MLSLFSTRKKRDIRKHLKVMDMFITLIVVMVSWMCTYVQTHQIIYIKHGQVFVYHSCLITKLQKQEEG